MKKHTTSVRFIEGDEHDPCINAADLASYQAMVAWAAQEIINAKNAGTPGPFELIARSLLVAGMVEILQREDGTPEEELLGLRRHIAHLLSGMTVQSLHAPPKRSPLPT